MYFVALQLWASVLKFSTGQERFEDSVVVTECRSAGQRPES